MLARKEHASDADRRLHGAGVFDEGFVPGYGRRKRRPGFGLRPRQPFREGGHGFPFLLADASAAHHEAVGGRVMAGVEFRDVGPRQAVVIVFVGRNAVGVFGTEHRPGERFAGFDVHFRALDGQPLFALGAVGAQLLLRKCRMQEHLLGHGQRLSEEFGERAEADIGVVPVDVDVEIGAVIVELFGDLLRRHVARAFREHVRSGRCREGNPLHGRSGAEHEGDAQHFEVVRGERVERGAVGERRLFGLRDLDGRGYYERRLCHLLAL